MLGKLISFVVLVLCETGCQTLCVAHRDVGGIIVDKRWGCWPVVKLLSVDEMQLIEKLCKADNADDETRTLNVHDADIIYGGEDGIRCGCALLYEYEVYGIARGNVLVRKYMFRSDFRRVRVFKRHLPANIGEGLCEDEVLVAYTSYVKVLEDDKAEVIGRMAYYYETEDEEKRTVDYQLEDLDYGIFPPPINLHEFIDK